MTTAITITITIMTNMITIILTTVRIAHAIGSQAMLNSARSAGTNVATGPFITWRWGLGRHSKQVLLES